MLKGCKDFYENKHINSYILTVSFSDLSDDDYYKYLMEDNMTLLLRYYERKKFAPLKGMKKLYLKRDASFRGFRQI